MNIGQISEPVVESTPEIEAWKRRKPAWSRNESARWLNDRSALVLAWMRRMAPEDAPMHSKAVGQWLRDHQPAFFNRAHQKLNAWGKDEARREAMTVPEVLS